MFERHSYVCINTLYESQSTEPLPSYRWDFKSTPLNFCFIHAYFTF